MTVPIAEPPAWTRDAACDGLVSAGRDPWHPDGTERQQNGEYVLAQTICAACPVRLACARLGLDLLGATGDVRGMYGGLRPDELRSVARSLGRPTRKVPGHGTRARYVNYSCRCLACQRANSVYEHDRRVSVA